MEIVTHGYPWVSCEQEKKQSLSCNILFPTVSSSLLVRNIFAVVWLNGLNTVQELVISADDALFSVFYLDAMSDMGKPVRGEV